MIYKDWLLTVPVLYLVFFFMDVLHRKSRGIHSRFLMSVIFSFTTVMNVRLSNTFVLTLFTLTLSFLLYKVFAYYGGLLS